MTCWLCFCRRVLDIEKEMNQVKCKYVKLLSMQFKIRISSKTTIQHCGDDDYNYDYHSSVGLTRAHDDEDPELSRHTEELLSLTTQEGGDQQNYRGSFEDDLGDIHEWQNDVLTQQYLCRLLYLHYNQAVRRDTEYVCVCVHVCVHV